MMQTIGVEYSKVFVARLGVDTGQVGVTDLNTKAHCLQRCLLKVCPIPLLYVDQQRETENL